MINKRIGIEDGHKRYEDYKWIIPFSYESNLEDFKENFVLNRTHCKYNLHFRCIFVVRKWVKLPIGGLATFRLGVGVSITGANYSQPYFFADMAHPINDSFYQYSAYECSAYFLPLITMAFFGQPLIVFFCPIRKQQIGC